ncbi:50S ribosomal protein L34e [Candidatus Woesearchaeota archaeon]|nr:MAG: 50S ribosomal protein L34e [Candidatus Woesearchaeota archaeon]
MPRGMYRSRTFRRVKVRTPGGSVVTHYKKRKASPAHCGKCAAKLYAVARGSPSQIRKIAKSSRRPERPYGGVLCSPCARREHISKARS